MRANLQAIQARGWFFMITFPRFHWSLFLPTRRAVLDQTLVGTGGEFFFFVLVTRCGDEERGPFSAYAY